MKKLLLCISCSTIVTIFIGFTLLFVNYIPNFIDFEIIRRTDLNSELSIEIAENYENTYETLEKTITEEKNIYGEDLPIGGRFIFVLSSMANRAIVIIYVLSLLPGIVLGTIIYIIFIKKSKGKKLIIEGLFSLSTILIIISIFSLVYNSVLNHIIKPSIENKNSFSNSYVYFVEDNNIILQFIIIFILVYSANMIYQKILTHRLNKTLEKNI